MKTLQAILLAAFVLAGVIASAAPIFAASAQPTHAPAGYVLDEQPTPTPTPLHTDGDPCSGGGC